MYTEIFKEILAITHQDYAGYLDKQGWDRPEIYLQTIASLEFEKKLNDEIFGQLVNEYLLDFNDNHIYFTINQALTFNKKTCGFSVQWYDDALYITALNQEKRLSIGDKIISIDFIPVREISINEQKRLKESISERQHWYKILNTASSIQYINKNNETINFEITKYDMSDAKETFEHKPLNESTYFIKLPNLIDRHKITVLINSSIKEISHYPNLIIDLRDNSGGDASTLASLEPYIFALGEKPNNHIPVRLFNCTERNVDLFIKLCDMYRNIELDSNTRNILNFSETTFKNNRGKGFIELDFSQVVESINKEFEGTSQPENIIILMNECTASAAESFIVSSSESSKVMTVGRATMGVNDYSDLVINNWENKYALYYPISKSKSLTAHHPIFGAGIEPDVHVIWTPEFINVDKDLEQALKILIAVN